MKLEYTDEKEFAHDVVKNARGAWVNGTFIVAGKTVAIKAFGKWIQRIQVNGNPYHSADCKTQSAMKKYIAERVEREQ